MTAEAYVTNQPPSNGFEEWKEINANIRHWETFLFGTAKDFLSAVTLALGGAGAALVWSGVQWDLRRKAIIVFLYAAIAIATCAVIALLSQQRYLQGFYSRRRDFQTFRLRKRASGGSGLTVPALMIVFVVVIIGSIRLL